MDWFYSEGGRQIGPVTEAEFEELVRCGRVRGETLVWHDALPNWEVYSTIRPSVLPAPPSALVPPPPPPGSGAAPPVLDTGATCAECGYLFPKAEMITYGEVWVCARCKPVFFQRIIEGAPLAASATNAWQSGDAVVLPLGGAFPPRCIKCNGAAQGTLVKRTLYWHTQWLYILLIVNLIIYVIVSLIVRKTAKVEVPLCIEDRARWVKWVTIAWIVGLLGAVLIIAALSMGSGRMGLIGVVVLLTGLVLGPVKATLVTAKKIDRDYIWIRGTGKEYRERLPEFPEGR